MAKIFSNIAKNTGGLEKVYSDSSVNNDLSTYIALRQEVGSNLTANKLLVTNRPQKVYDLYTDPRNISGPTIKTYQESNLISPENVTRVRRSGFYESFPIANGSLSVGNVPLNNTLIEIKPYTTQAADEVYAVDTSRMLRDSQTTPIVSGPRDIARMRNYLKTAPGLGFKTFQQVLQAGNTFGQARGYDPLSVETMTLNYNLATLYRPLERVPRLITANAISNPSLWGRIQKETVIDTQSKLRLKFVGGSSRPAQNPIVQTLNNNINRYLENRVNNINIPIPGFVNKATNFINRTFGTNFSVGSSVNLGQVQKQLDAISAAGDAIRRGLDANNATLVKDQTAYDALYAANLWPLVKENDGNVINFENQKQEYLQRARLALQKEKFTQINNVNKATKEYDQNGIDYRSSADYTENVRAAANVPTKSGLTTAAYVKDPMNLVNNYGVADASRLENIQDGDYITVKFKVPEVFSEGIFFRAFIEDLNHNAKGQYDEIRYVGRPERFFTYKGMSRSVSFSMYLIAFSQNELDTIWTRANMLNKLIYPIDNSGGFMTPPLVQLTIGNILNDQPGYVDNIDMRFQEIPWDIDKELPMAIKLNMTYQIIEKAYITQKDTSITSVQLFNSLKEGIDAGNNINVLPPLPKLSDIKSTTTLASRDPRANTVIPTPNLTIKQTTINQPSLSQTINRMNPFTNPFGINQ